MDKDLFENDDGIECDEVHTNIEAAVHTEGENNDKIDDEDFGTMDWKRYPGERARGILDYWRTIMNDKPHSVPSFLNAAKLVAVAQPSSAAAEPVFFSADFYSACCW